jgi:hypothetical protein
LIGAAGLGCTLRKLSLSLTGSAGSAWGVRVRIGCPCSRRAGGLHDFRRGDCLADMALGVIGDVHEKPGDRSGHLLPANCSRL